MTFFRDNTFESQINASLQANTVSDEFKIFLKFENIPLVNSIDNNQINSFGSSEPTLLEDGSFGQALRMRPLKTLSIPLFTVASISEFSMGFWLNPSWQKPSTNKSTQQAANYRKPLIDKAVYFIDLSSDLIKFDTDKTSFSIYEESIENNENVLRIYLQGAEGNVTYETEPYQTDQWHYFWITYNGPSGLFRVYIDGKIIALINASGSPLPNFLNVSTSVPFQINNSAPGFSSLIRGNSGLIDEVLYQDTSMTDENILYRHINLGSEYVIDRRLLSAQDFSQGFTFDDPDTININTIHSNGKNIYIGRSDGFIMFGDRKLWLARKDFSNQQEMDFIKSQKLSDDSVVDIVNGEIQISKAVVRIT